MIMMDGIIDDSEREVISAKFSGTPLMLPLSFMLEKKPEVMITEAYQNLLHHLRDIEISDSCKDIMETLEHLAEAGEVLDEDDADILKSILTSLKRQIT